MFISTFIISYTIPPVLAQSYFKKVLTYEQRRGYFTHVFMGTIHSLTAVALCFYLIVTGDLGNNIMYSKSSAGFVLMQVSLGFYIADVIVHIHNRTLRYSFQTYIHHGLSGFAIFWSLYYQGSYMHFGLFRLIAHLANPFVYTQYIMIRMKRTKSPLYTAASIGMTVTCLLTRALPLVWLWKIMFRAILYNNCAILPWILSFLFIIGSMLFDMGNIIICYKMTKGCIKHILSLGKKK